jgi:hypothetical protein
VQRWQQNGAASASKYKDSIMSLTSNPLEAAAQAGALYLQKIQESEAMGKRAKGLRDYGFSNWQNVTASKGSVRLGQGMAASADRMTAAMTKWLPIIDNLTSQLGPRGDLNQNLARADKFARGMAAAAMQG